MESQNSIQSKYFINNKDTIVKDCLIGECLGRKNIVYYPVNNFIFDNNQLNQTKVRLICGGGSGHEPAHAGFVTEGMLTCAVCGDIFSSPSCSNIIKAVEKVSSDKGVLIIVKNYTGDIINFSLAKELFQSQNKKIDLLIVDDDISLINQNEQTDTDTSFNKRRGLCGTVLVYKILGYMSQHNYSFENIVTCGKEIISALYTVGVSMTTCIVPFSSISSDDQIPEKQFELGLGIHGEKGKERLPFNSVDDVIKTMFDKCFHTNIHKETLKEMKDIVVIINNFGSMTSIEMNIVLKCLTEYIHKNTQFNLVRIITGTIMTSLDMKGFSLTIFNMNQNTYIKEHREMILKAIDYQVNATALYVIIPHDINSQLLYDKEEKKEKIAEVSKIKGIVKELFEYLKTKEDELNILDKKVGDGDIGSGVYKAMINALEEIDYLDFKRQLKQSFRILGEKIGTGFGGTSGPLYASFIMRGSDFLNEKEEENAICNWVNAFIEGGNMVQSVGKAKLGDRTMVDLIVPLGILMKECQTIEEIKEKVIKNMRSILDKIKMLKSKRGRSSYLNGHEVGYDEPGCILIETWLNYLLTKL